MNHAHEGQLELPDARVASAPGRIAELPEACKTLGIARR